MTLKMNITPKSVLPPIDPDMPCLSPKQVEQITGGAIPATFLKVDRYEAEQNGTRPKIPFHRFGYRTIRYKPNDIRAFIESKRVA